MNLKPLASDPYIQCKVSQKNKYCILGHIYMESRKMVLINLVENGLVDIAQEEEGEGRTN